jgi:hypothetical protein
MNAPNLNANRRVWSSVEARIASIAFSVGIYVAAFGGTIWLTESFGRTLFMQSIVPDRPLLVLGVALLLAQVSLVAQWWTRSRVPSHLRTLLALCGCAVLWVLLIALLHGTHFNDIAAAGWAAALATQAIAVAVGSALISSVRGAGFTGSNRFSILFLLIWMAVVGLVLGFGRLVTESAGWTAAELLGWQFLWQLQVLASCGAGLAIWLAASLALRVSWTWRAAACLAATVMVTMFAPLFMGMRFSVVGASLLDIAWLIGGQGLFVTATLAPLELARPASGEREA